MWEHKAKYLRFIPAKFEKFSGLEFYLATLNSPSSGKAPSAQICAAIICHAIARGSGL
jgi:hypothetical protein